MPVRCRLPEQDVHMLTQIQAGDEPRVRINALRQNTLTQAPLCWET